MQNKQISLVALAAASLYFELAIIRFTAAEVIYLGYFTNFILISAFLGLGLGFMSTRKFPELDRLTPFLLLFLFAFVLVSEFDVTTLKNHFGLFYFGNIERRVGLPGALLLFILFLATVLLFAGIGNAISRMFEQFSPLRAYSLDIVGSLVGIGIFTLQCMVATGPSVWLLTGALLLVIGYLTQGTTASKHRVGMILVSALAVIILLQSSDRGITTVWSMYQKLELYDRDYAGDKVLLANGVPHQVIDPLESAMQRYYTVPYTLKQEHNGKFDDVLIIGAGTGTDVAVALQFGPQRIDAVEIDRRILEIGISSNPDKPYQDPRVNLVAEDGRQFLRNTKRKYDLIIFALPDSLMRLSAMSSVRLESYLFTEEAFVDVKKHLKDDGMFVMYNQYRWPWLVNKLMTSLEKVFDTTPLKVLASDQRTTVIAVADGLSGTDYSKEGFERIATDDWPFVYMQKPAIHWLYLGMIGVFILVAFVGVAILAPQGFVNNPNLPYFFMGAAFLLLETKSIAFFSLLFGTTWFVNTLAFAGILTSVLLANLTVYYLDIRQRKLLFVVLFLSLAVSYLIPDAALLGVKSDLTRYVLAVMLVFSPIFFANLVFSREFRDSVESTRAFGWNLLGAVVGGGLEYLALMTGFKNLLLVVMVFYIITAITIYRNPAFR